MSIGIVIAEFNKSISDALLEGALSVLGTADIQWVPGAFELPIAAQKMAKTGKYSAILCLGAIIRGDTPHFDVVANACSMGIMQVSLTQNLPVLMGVLTTDTLDQAKQRAGLAPFLTSVDSKPQIYNVGHTTAQAALAMIA
jgi:6,7-dimethyl-8-ribityllumazine synthase